MNQLDNLKKFTTIVADTGDIEEIKKYSPQDATTNPSLIYKASQDVNYKHLIEEAVSFAKKRSSSKKEILSLSLDKLLVNFAKEILKAVPNRVSIEIDARLSFDAHASIQKAKFLIDLLEKEKIEKERILIKLASTWEGLQACRILEKENIKCNMTLLFCLPQAIVAADNRATLISPFVGRILDWHVKNSQDLLKEDPGVLSLRTIYNYFKKFNLKTEIMGASFRSTSQILNLAGCDLLTISPKLLKELKNSEEKIEKRLDEKISKKMDIEKIHIDEKKFRHLLCQNPMASEKLFEGIRKFSKDIVNLENFLKPLI